MNGKYAVSIGDDIIVWENGKYSSENKELEEDLRKAERISSQKPQFDVSLDGSMLYSGRWKKPSRNWAMSFGFLQDVFGGDLEFVAGDRPTWEKLGYEEEDGSVT